MLPKFSPTEVWARLTRAAPDHVTVFMGVPTMYSFLLNAAEDGGVPEAERAALAGSETVRLALHTYAVAEAERDLEAEKRRQVAVKVSSISEGGEDARLAVEEGQTENTRQHDEQRPHGQQSRGYANGALA
jgi:hypothetical protein